MKNANQIRQLLKTAKVKIRASWKSDESRMSRFKEIIEADVAIDEALALLPCETCNGTKQVSTSRSIGFGHENVIIGACPDCQKKPIDK